MYGMWVWPVTVVLDYVENVHGVWFRYPQEIPPLVSVGSPSPHYGISCKAAGVCSFTYRVESE